jgi:hypothetical protein
VVGPETISGRRAIDRPGAIEYDGSSGRRGNRGNGAIRRGGGIGATRRDSSGSAGNRRDGAMLGDLCGSPHPRGFTWDPESAAGRDPIVRACRSQRHRILGNLRN